MPPLALEGHIADIRAKKGDLDGALELLLKEETTLRRTLGDNARELGPVFAKISGMYHKRANEGEGDMEKAQDYLRMAEDASPPAVAQKLHSIFDREESRRIERLVEEEEAAEEALYA